MNLEELYRTVSFAYDRANNYGGGESAESIQVVIEVQRVGSVGATPTVPIKHISMGFDWDKGKMIICSEGVELREAGRDEIAMLLDKYEDLSIKQSEITRMRNEIKSLTKKIDKLEAKDNYK
ncbi:hypothetical protein M0R04_05000 [Candidatus Dojkabacteria bacterium]|jgi:hypothetical protein|nr:hypothetical protein [Candidatus Dojkabacteria bacterium]